MAPLDKKILAGIAYTIIAVYFGGLAWGEIAFRYFRHKCDTQAGEFIYQTVDDVEGIYQMRLRDPRDYFDRMRKGDIPEDPFGHTNAEAQRPWGMFIGGTDIDSAYQYFETTKPPNKARQRLETLRFENEPIFTGEKYWIYRRLHDTPDDAEHNNKTATQSSKIQSRYGFTWREIRDRWDRLFGIWGGELIAVDLKTSEELAIRRGFVLSSTLAKRSGICPRDKGDYVTANFIKKVLQPAGHSNL